MSLSPRQVSIASKIDARVRELLNSGATDTMIFAEMADLMPGFRELMKSAGRGGMDEICAQFEGFYRYARILEGIALDIREGRVKA